MIIVKPKFDVISKPDIENELDVYRYIERIGRTCYKSEGSISNESAPKFISMLNSRHHWAMLEHYIFRIIVPTEIVDNILNLRSFDDPDIQKAFDYIDFIHDIPRFYKCSMIIASATAINTLRDAVFHAKNKYNMHEKYIEFQMGMWKLSAVIKLMHGRYPLLINDIPPVDTIYEELIDNFINSALNNNCFRILNDEEILNIITNCISSNDFDLARDITLLATWFSVRFTVNRGVSHELVRHRPASYAQESTRYCNYANDKFANQITCICPLYYTDGNEINSTDPMYIKWKEGCEHDEKIYFELLKMGATPQQARGNLPTDLKTEIICTANLKEWLHIFNMRCDQAAHPQIREVMNPLADWAKKYYPNKISDPYISDIIYSIIYSEES